MKMDPELKMLTGVLFGVMAFFLIAMYIGTHAPDPHPVVKPLPACLEEDGSTQKECIWNDGSGLIVHNWDYGKKYETYARD